jgi:hypothetical protein
MAGFKPHPVITLLLCDIGSKMKAREPNKLSNTNLSCIMNPGLFASGVPASFVVVRLGK